MGSFHAARALLLPLTLLLLTRVNGQFPKVCDFNKATVGVVPCCPVWDGDSSMCGNRSGRGYCMQRPTNMTLSATQDERLNFPWGFYTFSCKCNSGYQGYNCGDCPFNRHGPTCNEICERNVKRKEMRSLTTEELRKYLYGLQLLKNTTSPWCAILIQIGMGNAETLKLQHCSIYDCIASLHTINSKTLLNQNHDPIHKGPSFCPWHKWLLLKLEGEMQKALNDSCFRLPFYNWSHDNRCTICTQAYLGDSNSDGSINPSHFLSTWKIICQSSGSNTYCMMNETESGRDNVMRQPGGRMPTYLELNMCMNFTNEDTSPYNTLAKKSARNCFEGWIGGKYGNQSGTFAHNQFHVYCRGDMLNTLIAANDPLFFLHHCFMDGVQDVWKKKFGSNASTYPQNNVVGHRPTDHIVGAFPPLMNKDMNGPSENWGSGYEAITL